MRFEGETREQAFDDLIAWMERGIKPTDPRDLDVAVPAVDEAIVMLSREARGTGVSGSARYCTALVRLASNIFVSESAIRRLPMPRLAKPPRPVT